MMSLRSAINKKSPSVSGAWGFSFSSNMNFLAGLLTFGSIYSSRLPDLFGNKSVATCEFRTRLQRRVRTGIKPVSPFAPQGTKKHHDKFCSFDKLFGM